MARKSSFTNMVLVLTSICLICSAIMGFVYSVTAEPIRLAEVAEIDNAISAVVPEFDNAPSSEVTSIENEGRISEVYPAKMGEKIVGYAIKTTVSGFGGPMQIMVGFTSDGTIYNTSVISHSETPGLGNKVETKKSPFSAQFKGMDPKITKMSVKKDGGDIDAISASTISSRAYTKGVDNACKIFVKIKEQSQE